MPGRWPESFSSPSCFDATVRQALPLPPIVAVPCNLEKFDLSAAESCGRGMASVMASAETMEAAARAGCAYLYDELRDADGRRACVLVRCYKTHAYGELPDDIQRVAKRAYGRMAFSPPDADLKCLVLLATVGDEPAWNDRRMSQNHQAIPLPSPHIVEGAPMIAQLIRERSEERR